MERFIIRAREIQPGDVVHPDDQGLMHIGMYVEAVIERSDAEVVIRFDGMGEAHFDPDERFQLEGY